MRCSPGAQVSEVLRAEVKVATGTAMRQRAFTPTHWPRCTMASVLRCEGHVCPESLQHTIHSALLHAPSTLHAARPPLVLWQPHIYPKHADRHAKSITSEECRPGKRSPRACRLSHRHGPFKHVPGRRDRRPRNEQQVGLDGGPFAAPGKPNGQLLGRSPHSSGELVTGCVQKALAVGLLLQDRGAGLERHPGSEDLLEATAAWLLRCWPNQGGTEGGIDGLPAPAAARKAIADTPNVPHARVAAAGG
mmetsp:Transcript_100072/g.283440  ORF Transcript_100072/g.283440 Transcript_100072/m.283440 type:complete len:248 (-) Transcript_100072:1765-2508(-)